MVMVNNGIPKIICVLKTGGDYDRRYVHRLMDAVAKNLINSYRFLCLTDDVKVDFCEVIPLKHGWPGWWSKMELFRPDLQLDRTVYFDLDTLILGDISNLMGLLDKITFAMLRGFQSTPTNDYPASGIMMGNFTRHSRLIYENFVVFANEVMNTGGMYPPKGDQVYIGGIIGKDVFRIQDYLVPGYILGKRHTDCGKVIPLGTKVLAWSGRPRLHEFKEGPLAEYWNGK